MHLFCCSSASLLSGAGLPASVALAKVIPGGHRVPGPAVASSPGHLSQPTYATIRGLLKPEGTSPRWGSSLPASFFLPTAPSRALGKVIWEVYSPRPLPKIMCVFFPADKGQSRGILHSASPKFSIRSKNPLNYKYHVSLKRGRLTPPPKFKQPLGPNRPTPKIKQPPGDQGKVQI